jgi:hypothetical protein
LEILASYPLPQALTLLLLYAYQVQNELDGGEEATWDPESELALADKFAAKITISLTDFYTGLEILTPQWKTRLQNSITKPVWDTRYKALLRYFVGRYWLQAVSDFDAVCRAKFAITACVLIGYLGGDLVETSQLFSKEIENDPDNVESILDGAYTARGLTDLNLLALLV